LTTQKERREGRGEDGTGKPNEGNPPCLPPQARRRQLRAVFRLSSFCLISWFVRKSEFVAPYFHTDLPYKRFPSPSLAFPFIYSATSSKQLYPYSHSLCPPPTPQNQEIGGGGERVWLRTSLQAKKETCLRVAGRRRGNASMQSCRVPDKWRAPGRPTIGSRTNHCNQGC